MKIKGIFSKLVTKSSKRLQYKSIDIEDVQTFLVSMCSSPNSRDGNDTIATVVESAKSLDEIFRTLSKYGFWDYLNYFLLQSLIEQFASDDDELNGMMEQYQKDLTGHILTLQIQTYLDATQHEHSFGTMNDSDKVDDENIPEFSTLPLEEKHKLFKKLSIKVDTNVTDHTLGYVYDLWRSLTNQFVLPQPAMILDSIAKGCLGITWFIPVNLVEHITNMAQENSDMFAKWRIVRITLEEQCIYPMETEPPLPESEATALIKKVCSEKLRFTVCI